MFGCANGDLGMDMSNKHFCFVWISGLWEHSGFRALVGVSPLQKSAIVGSARASLSRRIILERVGSLFSFVVREIFIDCLARLAWKGSFTIVNGGGGWLNERSRAKVIKQQYPSEICQQKAPERKISNERNETCVPKPQVPNERSRTKVCKRSFPNECSHTKVTKRKTWRESCHSRMTERRLPSDLQMTLS